MQSNRVSVLAFSCLVATLLVAGCGGGAPMQKPTGTGGAVGNKDGGSVPDVAVDKTPDSGTGASCPAGAPKGNTGLGLACACDTDCASGFCGNGFCCSTACNGKCMACNLPGSPGTCAAVPAGVKPSKASDCVKGTESSCGLDGTCDGAGACRSFVVGTVCAAGTCSGDGMTGVNICDGKGACRPGPDPSCEPYSCKGTACLEKCTTDSDCFAGHKCSNNSCGPLPNGRGPCKADADCISEHCADGVCCNTACTGECVSCNQTGMAGQCLPLGAGQPHPLCVAEPQSSCGKTGVCDGLGSCAVFAAEMTCVAPSCSGNMLNTAGTCDGQGICQPPGLRNCAPFMCAPGAAAIAGATDACVNICKSDADCVAPFTCDANGSCGPKPDGSVCKTSAQCASNHCVDGVCCDTACTGACQSCSLPSSPGQCKNAPKGAVDPHGQCKDAGAASCANNGKCDGSGGCAKYPVDTKCAAEKCASGTYTEAATCNEAGKCITPASSTCNPYVCNGAVCFTTCTQDSQCIAGKFCVNGSCGPKPPGAKCSAASECQNAPDGKAYCNQGVCCTGPCSGACASCALPGKLGTCSPLATTTVCRAANGGCDNAENCNGTGLNCPNDSFKANGTVCRGSAGACDNQETCSGTSAACPGDGFKASGTVCRAVNGACDNQETCPGNSAACPGDGFKASGTVCRAANGDCDVAETCPGNSGACPAEKFKASGTVCRAANGGCDNAETCSGSSGACPANSFKPSGAACSDNSSCSSGEACNGSGACVGGMTMACPAPTACHTQGTCDAATGKCTNPQVATGTACNDNNACTTGEACNASGNCAGGTTVACKASDQCHVAGTCDTATGKCSNPAAPNGTACNDGNACTTGDVCTGGVCGGTAKTCAASDKCHGAGICDGATGACSNPVTVTCTALDKCHTVGVCDGTTGMCTNPNAADGTTCSDGVACTGNDVCTKGVCAGTSNCPAEDACNTAGICDKTTGKCTVTPKKDGTACSIDGNACTSDTCQSGVCTAGAPMSCSGGDECNTAACDKTSGKCVLTPNTGASCSSDKCQVNQKCSAGKCGAGTKKCVETKECNVATCDNGTCGWMPSGDNGACKDASGKDGKCAAGVCVVPAGTGGMSGNDGNGGSSATGSASTP